MKIKYSRFFLHKTRAPAVFLTVLYFAAGCGPDKEALIREKVDERIAAFRIKENAKCREALLTEAGHIVDSLLLNEALTGVSDSLARVRPVKPLKPQPVPPIDSSPVKPLFNH